MKAAGYHDTRKVEFDLPDGLPEHRTPKGKRPMQPRRLRISYSVSYPNGRTHIYVEMTGAKLENDAAYGRTTVGDTTQRTFGTPFAWDRPHSTPATFDELGLPEWARPYVEENRPAWCPGDTTEETR